MDNERLTLVFMFHLSVAFDTIDDGIILQNLSERFVVEGDVLKGIILLSY